MCNPLSGVYTALVTPWNDDETFDAPTMRRLVDRQIEGGVQGLVACGTTGEAAAMSPDEHEQVVALVVEQAANRVPVIAGAGCNNTRHAMELSRRCAAAGANMLLHVTPYYIKPTQAGLIAHYRRVIDATDLPIVLYNVPGRTGVTISPATAIALAEDPRIIGIKQAVVDLDQLGEIIEHRPPGFAVLSGEDALTLAMIAMGAEGVVSVTSNEAPAVFVDLVHSARSASMARARLLHQQLLPLMRANFVEPNPIPVKYAMARLGLLANQLREPMTRLQALHEPQMDRALTQVGLLNDPPVTESVYAKAVTEAVK